MAIGAVHRGGLGARSAGWQGALAAQVGAVVVGFDRHLNYYKIQYATLCISENPGCHFIATNLDAKTHLTDAQEWAGNGSMVGAIKGAHAAAALAWLPAPCVTVHPLLQQPPWAGVAAETTASFWAGTVCVCSLYALQTLVLQPARWRWSTQAKASGVTSIT